MPGNSSQNNAAANNASVNSVVANIAQLNIARENLTESLIEAAKNLNFPQVIQYARLGGDINATFDTRDAMHVTPLHHLVKNIDSFIKLAKVPKTLKLVSTFKGVTKVSEIPSFSEEHVLTQDLFKYAKDMVELNAKVDAKLVTGETPLLLAAQQYPLVQQSDAVFVKKETLCSLISLFIEKGANLDVADSRNYKQGVMVKALQVAGKDPNGPLQEGVRPRTVLFDTIKRALAKRPAEQPTYFTVEDFECPISSEIMQNPVRTPKGHVFEETQLSNWLQRNESEKTCPSCRETLSLGVDGNVTPAEDIKFAIDAYHKNETLVSKQEAQQARWKMHGF